MTDLDDTYTHSIDTDGMYHVLRNGEKVGEINDEILALQIDSLTIHQTAMQPHGKYEYEVVKQKRGAENDGINWK